MCVCKESRIYLERLLVMEINISNVNKNIKGVEILRDVSLKMVGGKIYGIQGVNGSGKTMLMRAICGLIRTDNGEIKINDKIIGKDLEFPESVGVLIEKPGLIDNYTAMQNLKLLADIRKKTTDQELREFLIKLKLDPDDKRKVKKFSLGMRQKVGIVQAFIDNPDLLILDEPFNALDSEAVEILKNILREYINKDRIILLSCHSREILEEVCDEIFKMEEGKIVEK